MSKRSRDSCGHAASVPYLKNPHTEVTYVNPFELMMAAARSQVLQERMSASAGAGCGPQIPPPPTNATMAPCTHCGRQQQLLQLQQCESCQDVFCSVCSTLNYDDRDVRTFCIECNMQTRSCSAPVAAAAPSAASPCWLQQGAAAAAAGPASTAGLCHASPLPPGSMGRMPSSAAHSSFTDGTALQQPQGLGHMASPFLLARQGGAFAGTPPSQMGGFMQPGFGAAAVSPISMMLV